MQTAQKPIDSRFNAKTTAAEIAGTHDLTGKTALVTGGNSGLGFETVKALAAGGARVVALSSIGHCYMGVDLDDINFDHHPYDKAKAYGQSKTANSLFAVELDKRGQQYGVRAFAVHPGAVMTDINRYMTDEELQAFTRGVEGKRVPLQEGFKNAEQGAATSVWCALSEELAGLGGVYCEDCNLAELVPDDPAITRGVRAYAIDPTQAAALWQFSEKATGLNFP